MSASVQVPRGRYAVWLGGSIRGKASLKVDGDWVSTRRDLLNNEGLYAELGVSSMAAGRHRVTVHFERGDLAPGSGAASGPVGPLALTPTDEPKSELTTVSAAGAEALCGARWDWIEAVPAG